MSVQISTGVDVFNFYVIFQLDLNIPVGAITGIDYHQDAKFSVHVSDVIFILFTTVFNYHEKTMCILCLDYATCICINNYSRIASYSSADFFILRRIYITHVDSINYIVVSSLRITSYINTIRGDFKYLFFITSQLLWTSYGIVFNYDIPFLT